jgi:hypothetical protein
MHPWTTNKSTQTLDDCRISFESTGALASDNEYSEGSPSHRLTILPSLNASMHVPTG